MNISGIRTSAGFYDYNTIGLKEVRSQQLKEAKPEVCLQEPGQNDVTAISSETPVKPVGPDKGAEEFAKSYQPDVVYELKGADSDITGLDMEKALSDMKKDQVLEQYQFFVSESVRQKNDSLLFFREMENFYL